MSSTPKKLDVIDKWRARVLFRDTLPLNDSWAKRMERQMAVLRVFFPFLTEKQLRGKAWTACGFRSLMGELPRKKLPNYRSGLSLEVKRTFMKQGKNNRFTMSPKLKIKKESAIHEKKKLELSACTFDQSKAELLPPQENIVVDALPQTLFNCLNSPNLLSTNEIVVSSVNSDKSMKKGAKKRKLKSNKVEFNTQENAPLINNIISETSETSWKESNTAVKCKDLYCTQISKEKPTIIMTLDSCTSATISEFSTSTQLEISKNFSSSNNTLTSNMNLISDHQNHAEPVEQCDRSQSLFFTPRENQVQNIQKPIESLNIDSDSTFFKSNLPPTPQNYWSNPILNKKELVLYECNQIKKAKIENMKTSTCDEKFLKNQQILKNSSSPNMIKYTDCLSKDFNSDFNSNQGLIGSEFSNTEYEIVVNDNASQNENSTPFILSQTFSLPTTPQEPFENQPLLSNLCSEYEKAYNKEDYKPVTYMSSTNIVKKLKEDFDKIIPPQMSLLKYFKAEEKSFKQIQSEVCEKVNDIILSLEEDESREVSKIK